MTSEETAIRTDIPVGQLVVLGNEDHADEQVAYVRTCDDQILKVDRIKIEGGVENPPLRAAEKAGMTDRGTPRQNDSSTRVLLSPDALDGY